MPNHSTIRPNRVKKQFRQKTRKPVRPTQRATKRNPFAALAVTGIRSLVSALPGLTFLTPLVDLFFTSIGLTEKAFDVVSGSIGAKEVSFYGLCGMTAVSYANILARVSSTARNISKGPKIWFDTPYTDAKLESITISIVPDTKIQSRSGRWSCAFIPFRNVSDVKEILEQYKPLTLPMVQAIAGSVTSSADKSLSLTFRPRTEDGYIFQYNNISSFFGSVVIAYSEELRTSYHEFSADDFAPNVTIKGKLKLRQPRMDGSVTGYEDSTFIYNSKPRAAVYSTQSKTWRTYSHENFVCTESDKRCNISGTMWTAKYSNLPSLESMSIE